VRCTVGLYLLERSCGHGSASYPVYTCLGGRVAPGCTVPHPDTDVRVSGPVVRRVVCSVYLDEEYA
jgi:hypothetical protein